MENKEKDFRDRGPRGRFHAWAHEKMKGEDAFGIFYGEKGGDLPAEMKQEFVAMFEQSKEAMRQMHEGRKAFMDKWKEYIPEDRDCSGMGHMHRGGFHGMRGNFPGR